VHNPELFFEHLSDEPALLFLGQLAIPAGLFPLLGCILFIIKFQLRDSSTILITFMHSFIFILYFHSQFFLNHQTTVENLSPKS
jgi:uncharacterized membrane protein YphA (DoxX/SURF4 family)